MTGSGATPQQEIQRQHEAALQLIEQGLECSAPRTHHEIPLSQKQPQQQRPTKLHSKGEEEKKELDDEQSTTNGSCIDHDVPCWSSRGQVDVSKLQELVREGYNCRIRSSNNPNKPKLYQAQHVKKSKTNLWDPANAAVCNVHICRPSHDAWGIQKIVLIFCDDFLRHVYHLPFWQRCDIRDAVQPILTLLNVAPTRIVRLLLASMPPGVTIPIHYDTGAWVQRTHRVHVPVFVTDPSRVLFTCGWTRENMQRIDCTPGHVFELNNQANHAVSNCQDDWRVHLILDYVDNDTSSSSIPRSIIQLEPGERILQTRRSIDRCRDRGTRPTPSFLILGAQKAGTTSLYEYLQQHPLIVRARRRETHCLDWRWNDTLKSAQERRDWCQKFFFADQLQWHPSCQTGDSTPSYLLDSRRVIPRLQQVFDWPLKFLVMLRHPIRRAESHYAMATSRHGTAAQLKARGSEWRSKSFAQVARQDLQDLAACGVIPYWNMETGRVDQDVFDAFVDSPEEDEAWDLYLQRHVLLNTGSYCLLGRGLYALNLRPWLRAFDCNDFLLLQLERLQQEGGVEAAMDLVWQHLEVPAVPIEDTEPKNTRDYDSVVDEDLKRYLERFFEPHNQRLAALLGNDEWVGVWS